MRATMYGCEIVWPEPIGSGRVVVGAVAELLGDEEWRGTRSIASSTRSSSMSRSRSWCSTIGCRSSGAVRHG